MPALPSCTSGTNRPPREQGEPLELQEHDDEPGHLCNGLPPVVPEGDAPSTRADQHVANPAGGKAQANALFPETTTKKLKKGNSAAAGGKTKVKASEQTLS